ncbi:MAG: hypothetical protein NVS9B1_17380 [Candidatus Dormibacteraceae bacterium]
MPDSSELGLAAVIALAAMTAVVALAWSKPVSAAERWLRRREGGPSRRVTGEALLMRSADLIGSAPGRLAAMGAGVMAVAAAGAAGGLAGWILAGPGFAPPSVLAGIAAMAGLLVRRAATHRSAARERRLGELVPLLELLNLELSGGAAPIPALEAVLAHARSELAGEIRAQLIGSRVAGSAPFDVRLTALGDRHGLSELSSLGMILGLSRDYGSGVADSVRALAADLRRARRRRLIGQSRRALNRVLVPAAAGILLPFMAILLYPAVVGLMVGLR